MELHRASSRFGLETALLTHPDPGYCVLAILTLYEYTVRRFDVWPGVITAGTYILVISSPGSSRPAASLLVTYPDGTYPAQKELLYPRPYG